jgi:hypothetical protein
LVEKVMAPKDEMRSGSVEPDRTEITMNRLLLALICAIQLAVHPLVEMGTANAKTQSGREARREGSITGRITGDGGLPIANAGVFIRKSGAISSVGRTTSTDEDGRFHIDELPVGAYFVGTNVAGYVPADESGMVRYYRLGDAATIRLTKGGVITGAVSTSTGEPVVGAQVNAARVRDADGRLLRGQGGRGGLTDDRGIYRIYGLQSGSYLVGVNGGATFSSLGYAYSGEVPVFHPSGSRALAAEVAVVAGQEVTSIDIRYRGEQGHVITGTLTSVIERDPTSGAGTSITLFDQSTSTIQARSFVSMREKTASFALYGVPDGEYSLTAQFTSSGDESSASQPRRIVVRGADVTGIQLALTPLGSITGRFTRESLPEAERKNDCRDLRPAILEEAVAVARRDTKGDKGDVLAFGGDGAPNEKGEFALRNLVAGRYHVSADLPEDLYVSKITRTGISSEKLPIDASIDGLTVAAGQRLAGVTIGLAEGAAGLRGKLSPSARDQSLTKRRVHLVPAETESADDVLRFYEAEVDNDGAFNLRNIAPGRYFVLARAIEENELRDRTPAPVAWDKAARAALRREAQAANAPVELQRCERVSDFSVKYTPPPSSRRLSPKGR